MWCFMVSVCPPYEGQVIQVWTAWLLKMGNDRYFQNVGIKPPHFPEDFNLQQYRCENWKCHQELDSSHNKNYFIKNINCKHFTRNARVFYLIQSRSKHKLTNYFITVY